MNMEIAVNAKDRLADNWRWLLVLSVLPLFADNALYNAPLIIMALLGIGILIRDHETLKQQPEMKWLLLSFAALWLPQLLSLPDAVELERSAKTTLAYPAYLLAAAFIAFSLSHRDLQKLTGGILIILAIWIIDALLGWSGLEAWLGYETSGMRITGILFNKLTLGHIIAVLSPLAFEYLRRHIRNPLAWLLFLGVIILVLLSGRRIAWLMLAVAGAGYVAYMALILRTLGRRTVLIAFLMAVLVPGLLYHQYKPFRDRIDVTLGLFSSNIQIINKATSYRLDIWKTGISVSRSNWLNGVGPRGFRYVYEDYADKDDYMLSLDRRPTHPHQFMLEIAAETGLPGIIGYLLLWLMLFYAIRKKPPDQTVPYALIVLVALFPLNAHVAFYGSYWTALVWWLLGILFAVARVNTAPST